MKNLYTEIFKQSIKIGDTVYITKEGGNNDMLQGRIKQILPNKFDGLRVEIILDTQNYEEFQVKEIGFVEYVVRDAGVEYGTLK